MLPCFVNRTPTKQPDPGIYVYNVPCNVSSQQISTSYGQDGSIASDGSTSIDPNNKRPEEHVYINETPETQNGGLTQDGNISHGTNHMAPEEHEYESINKTRDQHQQDIPSCPSYVTLTPCSYVNSEQVQPQGPGI